MRKWGSDVAVAIWKPMKGRREVALSFQNKYFEVSVINSKHI